MPTNFKIKALTVAAVIVIAVFCLLPTLGVKMPDWMPSEKINLGLDLQGGMHLILEVDVEKALAASLERNGEELYRRLRESSIRASLPETDGKTSITFTLSNPEDQAKLEDLTGQYFPDFDLSKASQITSDPSMVLTLSPPAIQYYKEQIEKQALETIHKRIDGFGVKEPEVIPQAGGRILIQLPGVHDSQRAIETIDKIAHLEFKLVDDAVDARTVTPATLPRGSQLAQLISIDSQTGRTIKEPIVLRSRVSMTGDTITDARAVRSGQFGDPTVSVSFDASGTRQFAELTSQNVNRRLAIVLDGNVLSAPNIREPITGGQASITGMFNYDEAASLAVALRSGALPAPVRILEERTVGPSLGQDSITQGVTAALFGGMLVIIFMAIYYRLAGLAADFAVVLNVVIIMAVMVLMQATLTLPGIAGIILTIGMAVDANVLINERIREELRLGKTPAGAVENGYARATITILDANITTILAAIVLYQFGTGPIKGFAVTLTIGLASSMFTAIVVTRLLFDYALRRYRPKQLWI